MKLTIIQSEQDFFEEAAERIATQIEKKPDSVIGLATGRTTSGIHAALARRYSAHPFDTSKVRVFAMDEITNMSRECPASCYYLIYNDVVKPLNIPISNMIMPDPMAKDPVAESKLFEKRLGDLGSVDFQELGIGENGHLGFNQPGTPFESTTWVSWMDDQLYERLCREYSLDRTVPMGGLTIGIKNIMMSEQIMLVANGAHKAKVVADAVRGPITSSLPASVLQLHPHCEFLLDGAAGTLLADWQNRI